MKIKEIGTTIEKLESVEISAAFGFDVSFVVWASVKKDDWKKFHKLVVKIPAKREQLQIIDKNQLVDTAIKKMQEVLAKTIVEPE